MKALRYFVFALVVSVASADTYYEKTTIPPTIAANKVLGNGTASTAAPQQLAVASCSTSSSALIWTTSTGFGCNTSINAGTLGSATFANPGAIGGGTPGTSAFTTISATGQITSTLVTGTAPFSVASTTNVANLNASTLSGATFAAPGAIGGGTPAAGAFTTLSATGVITSTQATGTAPFTVASTTNVANLNASSLGGATFAAPGAIGGGTPGSGAFTALSATTFSFSAGTAFTGATWATVSPVWNSLALTLNDTTASGTVLQDAAYSIQAPTFTSTGGASTTLTNADALWIGTPLCTGGLVCTNLYSLFTTGSVRTGGAIIAGTTSITGAATITGGNIILNNSGSTTSTLGAGSSSGTVTIGSASGPNTVNLAAGTLQVVGRMYSSSTIPVINAHFNTSSDTVTATSTAAFRVTVGTSTASNTGSLTFPAATTGWSCKVTDATTNASFIVEAFSTSTTAVTVNNYSRTTGLAANFTNSEKLDFICGAF